LADMGRTLGVLPFSGWFLPSVVRGRDLSISEGRRLRHIPHRFHHEGRWVFMKWRGGVSSCLIKMLKKKNSFFISYNSICSGILEPSRIWLEKIKTAFFWQTNFCFEAKLTLRKADCWRFKWLEVVEHRKKSTMFYFFFSNQN
jgi:hypothetical protein